MDQALTPAFRRLAEMDVAWAEHNPGERLHAVRRAGQRLRQRILDSGRAVSVRTFPMNAFPYPAQYGLGGAAASPAPYVILRNSMQLVQVEGPDGVLINVLINPTDRDRSAQAPFFARMLERPGGRLLQRAFPSLGTLPGALASAGLAPEDIDYITFDHLHVQDVRGLLGTTAPEPGRAEPTRAFLPRARLLVQAAELHPFRAMHPSQARWYVRDGIRDVPPDRIVVLEGDYLVGGGLALVRTPGHTEGNHSPVLHTDRGLWTISENGVAVECYAPMSSKVAGLRRHARDAEVEFILNGNTRESTLDQYISMALEKTLADPSHDRPEFPQCFPSSEMIRHVMAPGLAPTFAHGEITHGQVRSSRGDARNAVSAA